MAYVNVVEWKPDQVTDWLKGLDDVLLPYLHSFLKNEINGQYLLNIQHDELEKLGVHKLGHQEIILEAVEQLRNFHYDLDRENLQLLALRLSCSAHSLHNELLHTHSNSALLSTQTLADVANIVTTIKPLVCWLDRPPFSDQVAYIDKKSELLKLSLEMATSGQRDRFADNLLENIRSSCKKLAIIADQIIQGINDPLILQPASLDLVTLKKRPGDHLGFYIVPSFHGIHQIGELKCNSAAHQCGKIECGDEIVQINYQTVVGWQVKQVMVLFEESSSDVFLTLKKRPRHTKVFGQIYMKPYRLPSKKHAASYTSRWHDSLPSPRPELLSIPHFTLPLPVYTETVTTLSDECKDESTSSSDEDIGHASPTSMRLYLPKPRVPAQRRATITGASPVSKRPPVNIDEFWNALKFERQWRSTSEENKKFNSETLLRRSIDSPLPNSGQMNVPPKCSSAQCLVGSGSYDNHSFEKERKFKENENLERGKASSNSLLQEECKFISLKERIEMFSKNEKISNSNNINSQANKPKVPPKNFKLNQVNKLNKQDEVVNIVNKPDENINITFVSRVKQRGKLDKSYSTPTYDLNTIDNANTNLSMNTFVKTEKIDNFNFANVNSCIVPTESTNSNINKINVGTTRELNSNVSSNLNINNSLNFALYNHDHPENNFQKLQSKNMSLQHLKAVDNSAALIKDSSDSAKDESVSPPENKCNTSFISNESINNTDRSNIDSNNTNFDSNISYLSDVSSNYSHNLEPMEIDSSKSEHGQMVNTINDHILLNHDDQTVNSFLPDDIDIKETTKMNEILETISSSLAQHHSPDRPRSEEQIMPKFKVDSPDSYCMYVLRNTQSSLPPGKVTPNICDEEPEASSSCHQSSLITKQSSSIFKAAEEPKPSSNGPSSPLLSNRSSDKSSSKFRIEESGLSTGNPSGIQTVERLSPKLKVEDSYYYCNLYQDAASKSNEQNYPQSPRANQMVIPSSNTSDKAPSRSESPYERLVINQQVFSNECYGKPTSLDLGSFALNSPEIRITTPTSVKSEVVDFDRISLASVSSSPAPATFPRHRTDKKPLTPPPRPAKPAAESKGGCYRAMMVAKSMGKSASLKVTASPRLLRKKNPLLSKRRNISVKELGVCESQGWLSQRVRGGAGAQWNKGWFALKGTSFLGFNSNESQKARIMIFLPGFTVSVAEEVKSRKFAFKVYHAGTTFYFAADSSSDLAVWLDAITASTIANDIHTETVIYSETDGEEEESQSEHESCFPSPKMKKFSGLFSSDALGKSSEFQKKFGSLKKLGSRNKPVSADDGPNSESLDRKYLKFLGSNNVPTPTAQFRSYRRVPPSPPITTSQRRKDNSHHCSAESVLAHPERSLSERCSSPVNMTLPPDMGDYRLASLARARDSHQRQTDQENPGFVTLEAFMLARQEEERRQQQQEMSRMTVPQPSLPLPPQVAPRTPDLDSFSEEARFRCNRNVPSSSSSSSSSSSRLRYVPQPTREYRGGSPEKFWIDSLRRSDVRIQNTPHSTNTVPDLRTKRLKKAANYQPPPVSPLDNASPGPSDMRFAFEMTLGQSQSSSRKNHKQSQSSSKALKSFFSPSKGEHAQPSQKTLLGSPRLHRVLFREKKEREPPVPPPRPLHTLSDRLDDDLDSRFNNSRTSMDSLSLRLPPPPDYPGLEYPPIFEPETYSLSNVTTIKRDKNTKDDTS